MLEEKDLTSEERVRLECLDMAVRAADLNAHHDRLIQDATKFEAYIRGENK